ncbi:MAG: hypothetical protein AB7T63_00800 [Planctomycetota bacterium]
MAARSRRKGPPPPHPFLQRLALVLIRVFPGAVLLDSAIYKLTFLPDTSLGGHIENFRTVDFHRLVEDAVLDPPRIFGVPWHGFASFVQDVALGTPSWERFVCGSLLAAELLLGALLVLGLGTRLVAVLAALLMTVFGLAKAAWIFTPNTSNWLLVVLLVAAAFLAAGRVLGLDAKVAGRWPRWLS